MAEISFVASIEDLKLKKGKISLIDMKLRTVFGHDLWSQLGDIMIENAIEVKMVVSYQADLFPDAPEDEETEDSQVKGDEAEMDYEVVDDYEVEKEKT